MLHRAVLGSLERFIAIYVEHTGGDFPLFLAPQQVAVLPVSDRQTAYAHELAERLRAAGVRAEADVRNETLNYRVRAAETQKIPYVLVVGEREQESRQRQRAPPPQFGPDGAAVRAIPDEHPGGDQNAWDFVDAVGGT